MKACLLVLALLLLPACTIQTHNRVEVTQDKPMNVNVNLTGSFTINLVVADARTPKP